MAKGINTDQEQVFMVIVVYLCLCFFIRDQLLDAETKSKQEIVGK